MSISRAGMFDWYWVGGPGRRLLVGLAITAVVAGLPYLANSPTPTSFVAWLLGWDFGSWFMDRMYIDRQSRRKVAAQ